MTIVPTPEQRAVVAHGLSPVRVAAGAGTGKTTTMALRLANLVTAGDVAPEQALGITFTNKAAAELRDRIRAELPDLAAAGRTVEVATYHGFAHGLVREFGAAVGVERTVAVVSPGYTRQLLREALAAGRYRWLDLTAPGSRVEELAALSSELGDQLLEPAGLAAAAPSDRDEVWQARLEMLGALDRFQRRKAELSVVDYADLVRLAARLVRQRPEVAARIRARYLVVLLDEYQDTNPGQRELLRGLFGDGFPVTAVGDADQTIYEWRGASLDNFAAFPEHFPAADGSPAPTLELRLNRRSDRRVLAVAATVRSRIGGPVPGGPLRPGPQAGQGTVTAGWFRTAAAEARWLAGEARRLHDEEGHAWGDLAVLFRKNAQIALVRDALEAADIPVEVTALGGLLDVPEVADLHAWLRLLGRPEDGTALARILLGSHFRLGLADLAALAARAGEAGDEDEVPGASLLVAIYDACPGPTTEAAARLDEFRGIHRELLQAAQGSSLVELCRLVLDRTAAWAEVEALPPSRRAGVRGDFHRFLDLAEQWSPLEGRPSLEAFLDHLDALAADAATEELDTARPASADAVVLSTVHRAKGLEWPVVFLPALCEGIFPSRGSPRDPARHAHAVPAEHRLDRDAFPGGPEAVRAALAARHHAQEWRTAYVAVTRARHRLYGTGAFWHGDTVHPRTPSELFDAIAGADGAVVVSRVADPGEAPAPGQIAVSTAGAPDPHFPAGWQEVLRREMESPGRTRETAAGLGGTGTYDAAMEQLRIVLDGLPPPLPPSAAPDRVETSVSGLVTLATCPLRFRFAEIDRLPRRPSPHRRRGVRLHRRIELHNRGTIALDEAGDGFFDLTDEEAPPAGPVRGPDPFATFLDSRFARERPRFVEAPFELRVGEARIRGRVDAIYEPEPDRWEIVDFKTGRPGPDPARLVQLQAYAVAAREAGFGAGEPPARMDASFVFLGGGLAVHTERVDPPWLDAARARLEGLAAAAAGDEHPPAPGPACRGCDFLRFCDAGRDFLGEPYRPGAV